MKTVILAAGFGSRLWPLSTSHRPKQFQKLISNESLLQYTYELLSKVTPADELYVLTLSGLEHLVHEQLPEIDAKNIIIVPERRNTLPHTLFAIRKIADSGEEPILFSPVHHYMADQAKYLLSLGTVIDQIIASNTISILCTRSGTYDPNAGYVSTDDQGLIIRYREKPSNTVVASMDTIGTLYKDTASYIASSNALLRAIRSLDDRQLSSKLEAFMTADDTEFQTRYLELDFMDIPTQLFEKVANLQALRVDGEFTDIGRYSSLYDITPKDQHGNAIIGEVVISGECKGCLIINRTDQPLVALGAKDTVIVQSPEGTLCVPIINSDKIGEIYKSQIR